MEAASCDICACQERLHRVVTVSLEESVTSFEMQQEEGRLLTVVPEGTGTAICLKAPERAMPVLGGEVSGSSLATLAFLQRMPALCRGRNLLELGAGRGLLGIGAAALGGAGEVTDLEPEICAALRESLQETRSRGTALRGLEVRQLDWDDGLEEALSRGPGLLLGSELLWADDAVEALLEAVVPAVVDHDWIWVYGAALRPSNDIFMRRLAAIAGTSLSCHGAVIETRCGKCHGVQVREETNVLLWKRSE